MIGMNSGKHESSALSTRVARDASPATLLVRLSLAALAVAVLILLSVLGCLSATPEPTPTAVPLNSDQQGPRATERVRLPTSTPLPLTATPTPAESGESASAPDPTAAATPESAGSGATSGSNGDQQPEVSDQPRVMALGRVGSVFLRTGPSESASLLLEVSGSDVLWVEAQSSDGLWSLVSTADGLSSGWVLNEQLVLLGDPESLPVAQGEVVRPSEPTATASTPRWKPWEKSDAPAPSRTASSPIGCLR